MVYTKVENGHRERVIRSLKKLQQQSNERFFVRFGITGVGPRPNYQIENESRSMKRSFVGSREIGGYYDDKNITVDRYTLEELYDDSTWVDIFQSISEKNGLGKRKTYFTGDTIDNLLLNKEEIEIGEIDSIQKSKISSTEKETLIKSRKGQGRFREEVLREWDYRCAVTGSSYFLIASHIKPWKDSSNRERLDRFNGIALSPLYDKAFDVGLITFKDNGQIVLSPYFSIDEADRLGIAKENCIKGLKRRHRRYLKYHRNECFLNDK